MDRLITMQQMGRMGQNVNVTGPYWGSKEAPNEKDANIVFFECSRRFGSVNVGWNSRTGTSAESAIVCGTSENGTTHSYEV